VRRGLCALAPPAAPSARTQSARQPRDLAFNACFEYIVQYTNLEVVSIDVLDWRQIAYSLFFFFFFFFCKANSHKRRRNDCNLNEDLSYLKHVGVIFDAMTWQIEHRNQIAFAFLVVVLLLFVQNECAQSQHKKYNNSRQHLQKFDELRAFHARFNRIRSFHRCSNTTQYRKNCSKVWKIDNKQRTNEQTNKRRAIESTRIGVGVGGGGVARRLAAARAAPIRRRRICRTFAPSPPRVVSGLNLFRELTSNVLFFVPDASGSFSTSFAISSQCRSKQSNKLFRCVNNKLPIIAASTVSQMSLEKRALHRTNKHKTPLINSLKQIKRGGETREGGDGTTRTSSARKRSAMRVRRGNSPARRRICAVHTYAATEHVRRLHFRSIFVFRDRWGNRESETK
jgi:hypothetical protein